MFKNVPYDTNWEWKGQIKPCQNCQFRIKKEPDFKIVKGSKK